MDPINEIDEYDPANEVARDNAEAVLVDGEIISENDPY